MLDLIYEGNEDNPLTVYEDHATFGRAALKKTRCSEEFLISLVSAGIHVFSF